MITIEKGKLDAAIRLTLMSGATPVTGLTAGDLAVAFFTADGNAGAVAGFDLTEVDSVDWAGVYLLTTYGEDLVAVAGPAGLKVVGGSFDDFEVEIDISETAERIMRLHRLGYARMEWNVDDARWDLYDEEDALLGWFPAQDVNGNPPIIDSTHPVTRLAFVPAP